MNDLCFDTCFLIDLERERRRGSGGAKAAMAFLKDHATASPWISWIVAGEFADGFGDIDHPGCSQLLSLFNTLPFGKPTASAYAGIASRLRESGQQIGANDVWIAASALANQFPLVSNNWKHFNRVPGLHVLGY
jgi:predicted nucleic acid-binding protein